MASYFEKCGIQEYDMDKIWNVKVKVVGNWKCECPYSLDIFLQKNFLFHSLLYKSILYNFFTFCIFMGTKLCIWPEFNVLFSWVLLLSNNNTFYRWRKERIFLSWNSCLILRHPNKSTIMFVQFHTNQVSSL